MNNKGRIISFGMFFLVLFLLFGIIKAHSSEYNITDNTTNTSLTLNETELNETFDLNNSINETINISLNITENITINLTNQTLINETEGVNQTINVSEENVSYENESSTDSGLNITICDNIKLISFSEPNISINKIDVSDISIDEEYKIIMDSSLNTFSEQDIEVDKNVYQILNEQDIEVDKNVYQILKIPDYGFTNEIGKPKLPAIRMLLAVPSLLNISLKIIEANYSILPEDYKIYPVQEPLLDLPNQSTNFTINKSFYSTDIFYPDKLVNIGTRGILRDYNVIQLEIFPFQYNPLTKKVRFYSNLVIELKFKEKPSKYRESLLFKDLYKGIIFNYDSSKDWPARVESRKLVSDSMVGENWYNTSNRADYLIITNDTLYESILPLADWKEEKGLEVEVVNVSDINDSDNDGIDDTDIRNFINYTYHEWTLAPTYVLLVGDVDEIPLHDYGDVCMDTHCSSDHYYTCLDGGDLYPEIAIGRFPASNAADITRIANKTINYEKNPVSGDWIEKILLVAHSEGAPGKYQGCKEHIGDNIISEEFEISKVYAYEGGSKQNILDNITKGKVIVNYRGHGSSNSWQGFSLGQGDMRAMDNGGKLPMIFSISCYNSKIDSPGDCIAEASLKADNSSIAYLGATRASYTYENHEFDKDIFRAIFDHNKYKAGEIIFDAFSNILVDYSSGCTVKYYILLGDPELELNFAPIITFEYPVNGTHYNDYTGEINISINEDGGNCSLNDTRWDYTIGNKTFFSFINNTAFLDGNYTINVSCWDDEATPNNRSKILWFNIDTIVPNINFTDPTPADGTHNQSYIPVNVTALDTNLNIINISLYDSSYNLLNSTTDTTSPFFLNFTSLKDMSYYLNATATDSAGNINSIETRNITLNASAPTITFEYPPNGTHYNDYTGEINISMNEYGGNCSLNDTRWDYTNDNKTFFSFINNTDFSDGNYTINVSCWDRYNQNGSKILSFTLDTIVPNINFTDPTPANGTYSQSYIPVNVTASDTNLNIISISLYELNESGYYNLLSSNTSTTSPLFKNFTQLRWGRPLSDGTYYINATVNDTAGNINSTETRLIVLDTTYPQISFSSGTEANYTNKSQTYIEINVTWTETNFANITFNINGTEYVNTSATYEYNETSLSDGNYSYNITVCDTLNKCNTTETRLIILDTLSPQIEFSSGTEANYTNKSQTWIYSNITLSELYVKNVTWNINGTEIVYNATTYNHNQTSLGDGNYSYNVTSCDYSGNCNSTETRLITLDATYPVISLITLTNASTWSSSSTVTFTYNVTDLNNILNCSLIINDTINQSSLSITKETNQTISSSLSNADYNWSINCTDKAGNENNSETRKLTVSYSSGNGGGSGGGGGGAASATSVTLTETGETYTGLRRNDKLSFSSSSAKHTLTISKVSSDKVDFILASDPIRFTLSVGEERTIDIGLDEKLYVKLNNIKSRKADITIKNIVKKVLPTTTLPEKEEIENITEEINITEAEEEPVIEEKKNYTLVTSLIISSIIIISLIGYFYVKITLQSNP